MREQTSPGERRGFNDKREETAEGVTPGIARSDVSKSSALTVEGQGNLQRSERGGTS